jgi:hypothetical protein
MNPISQTLELIQAGIKLKTKDHRLKGITKILYMIMKYSAVFASWVLFFLLIYLLFDHG